MPTEAVLQSTDIWKGNPAVCLARCRVEDGTYLTQADLSSVDYVVYDLDAGSAQTGSDSISPDDCVYDTLQTDDIWTKDTTGYNLKLTLPASCFPTGSHRYRAVVTLKMLVWDDVSQPFEFHTEDPAG